MRYTIWMLGLSLAISGAARADEPSPIPRPEARPGEPAANPGSPLWPPMLDLEAEARKRLFALPAPLRAPQVKPEVARLEADGTLSLRAQDIGVVDLIQQIASTSDIQVLVDANVQGRLRLINIVKKTPEQALEIVAQACRLEIHKKGAVFFVRRAAAVEPERKPEDPTFSMSFKDSTAGQIIELLAKQSNVPIDIEGALSEKKIGFMRLRDVPLKAALDNIAMLLDAQVAWKDGRYILSARPK